MSEAFDDVFDRVEQKTIALLNENQTLRDERDRLAKALREIAYEDIDLMQARALALTALTPAGGGKDEK